MPKTFQNPAVPSTNPVVFVQGNKIIGKGRVAIRHGDNFVGVRVDSGPIAEMVKDLELVTLMGLKCAFLRFMPVTGVYAGDDHQTGEGGTALLQDVRVVDEHNLAFGIVPESFKDVEGYRSAFSSSAAVSTLPAVPATKPVLIVQDNTIVGKGRVVSRTKDTVNVRLTAGPDVVSLILDLDIVKKKGLNEITFLFDAATGDYVGQDTVKGEKGKSPLQGVRVVDEDSFKRGLAPDSFKDVPGYNTALALMGVRGSCYFVCENRIIGNGDILRKEGNNAVVAARAGLLFLSLAQLHRAVAAEMFFDAATGAFVSSPLDHVDETDAHNVMGFLKTVSIVRCIDFHAATPGLEQFAKVAGYGQPAPENYRNAPYVGASIISEPLEPNVPGDQLKLAEEALRLIAACVSDNKMSVRDISDHASAVLKRIQSLRHD